MYSNEHETGQYIKVSDTESTFNTQVQDVFDSPLSQTHAFVEKAYFKELQEDQTIFKKKNPSLMYSTIKFGTASKALQLILTNAVRIYCIMVNLIIVFLLCLIK
jgi:hypothetical protein